METPPASQPPVNLVVRNVYVPSQSLALSVDPKTLVSELKHQLSVDFPTAPAVSAQKLIFGGKICGDDEPLEQVLSQMQSNCLKDDGRSDEHVVLHLLVTSLDAQKSAEPKAPQRLEAEAQDSPRPSTSAVSEAQTFVVQPEPHEFHTQPAISSPSLPSHIMSGQTQPHHTLYTQSVLMQQQAMVVHQIQYLQMMLMQQQVASMSTAQQVPHGAHVAAPHGNCYGTRQPQTFHASLNGPQTLAQEPVGSAPIQAQAFTIPETREEPRPRIMLVEMLGEVVRLLDFRLAFKMAFMLLIVGKDTPVNRVLMLIALSLISYLYITGIFAKAYEIYTHHRSRSGDSGANAPVDANLPGAAAGAAAITNRYDALVRVLRISGDRGFYQDVKYFGVGLLMSLVPAWRPQPTQGDAPVFDNAVPDAPLQGI